MFQSIIFNHINNPYSVYLLQDSEFTCQISIISNSFLEKRIMMVDLLAKIIFNYSKRQKNISKNVALYYSWENYWLNKQINKYAYGKLKHTILEYDKQYIDINYPELEYGVKHYPCVLNQLDKLRYINRK